MHRKEGEPATLATFVRAEDRSIGAAVPAGGAGPAQRPLPFVFRVQRLKPETPRHQRPGARSAHARERGAGGQRLPQLLVRQGQQAQQVVGWPRCEGPGPRAKLACRAGRGCILRRGCGRAQRCSQRVVSRNACSMRPCVQRVLRRGQGTAASTGADAAAAAYYSESPDNRARRPAVSGVPGLAA